MLFILAIAAVAAALTLVVTLLVRLGWLVARRRPQRFWRRALLTNALAVPVHLLLIAPLSFGCFASRYLGTRGDESGYAGPRIAVDGTWMVQSRGSLKAEADAQRANALIPAAPATRPDAAETVHLQTSDGVTLRAFHVAPREAPPRCTVLLVHGLVRGGLELEPPAGMFRDLGAETLMLEMRNHGGSGRAPVTFGLHEKQDVLAAVAWLRADPARAPRPLVIFAVSLGTAAVMRAAPEITQLAGLVLDAPMEDLLATAHRTLAQDPRPGRRGLAMWQPFRSLTIASVELWSGVRFADVHPIDDVARLGSDVPVLLIGGSEDKRMPPASVQAIFDRLPSTPARKTLWIRQGSDHGLVWLDDPAGYAQHLAALLDQAAPSIRR